MDSAKCEEYLRQISEQLKETNESLQKIQLLQMWLVQKQHLSANANAIVPISMNIPQHVVEAMEGGLQKLKDMYKQTK